MRRRILTAFLLLAACAKNETSPQPATITINGAGATFPNPIYSKWISDYNKLHPNVQINYQSIGPGGGIKQLSAQTVFFGASDMPMNEEQLKGAPGPVLHFPTVLGAVVPAYKQKVGASTAVNWPAGVGGKGNEGVAGLVKQTPGSIGYVELIYALQNNMPYAKVANKSGANITPSLQ